MKKGDVKVGERYLCNFGRNKALIEIVEELPDDGGWTAKNVNTGKQVRVRCAQRLHLTAEAQQAREEAAAGERQKAGGTRQGKTSLLDAAAQVLGEADGPMNTREIVAQVLDRGLWSTDGKTPAATLYAAILREIQKKGDEARFEKVERGKFTLRS